MVVSIDKATAVKMYDQVKQQWGRYLHQLKAELSDVTSSQQRWVLEEKIRYLEETDMAVVVSQSQNEIQELKKKGVDIIPHRQRMVKEDLDTKFKDPDDPFRIVFVCAMWMTGFDVPCCSTIYLDKPQRNHTLMQTIARANRVFQDKVNGLIVDYIGVFRNLEQALSIYASTAEAEGATPIKDKAELVEQLKQAIAETTAFCANLGIDLGKIEQAEAFQRIKLIEDAENELLINDDTKQQYLQLAANVAKLYKAILPDPSAAELVSICSLINIIGRKITADTQTTSDISEVTPDIEGVLDASIAAEWTIDTSSENRIDLGQIDFDQLREKFRTKHKRLETEKLRVAINKKLSRMIRVNKTRLDYQAKFEQMIDEYNEGIIDVDVLFEQLLAFVRELNEEDQRSIAAQLTE